jgi:hypothetical protein
MDVPVSSVLSRYFIFAGVGRRSLRPIARGDALLATFEGGRTIAPQMDVFFDG